MTWRARNGTLLVGHKEPDSQPLGILYPRAGVLGGCAQHHWMVTTYPQDADWDQIADLTEDSTWNASSMRRYFEKLEHNDYEPKSTTGYGFTGWLHTKLSNYKIALADKNVYNMLYALAKTLGNVPAQDQGVQLPPFSKEANGPSPPTNLSTIYQIPSSINGKYRSSPRDFILQVANAKRPDGSRKYHLDVRLHTLATDILFKRQSGVAKAVGIEYLEGTSLYAADPRADLKQNSGKCSSVFASREIIISAGTFNTPQLLKLSGVGPEPELEQHKIPVVHNLPGVGKNMQERYEVAVVTKIDAKYSFESNCTFKLGSDDPCYEDWLERDDSLYANLPNLLAVPRRSSTADDANPDLLDSNSLGYFNGWYPGFSTDHPATEGTYLSWLALKGHTRNTAGTVTLRSSNPRDVPDINFNSFDTGTTTDGGDEKDLQAMYEQVQFFRQVLENQEKGNVQFREVIPGPAVSTEAQIKDYIKNVAWGHHACCVSPIGADDDTFAVLDSRFRVRGVDGLRVVDASVFPKIPGFFISLPTYMISEKAADVIIEDAQGH